MSDLDHPVLFPETHRDEQTGVTYQPASFERGIGFVVTHPDGRKECLILSPSLWHDVNERGSQGDTFLYQMTTAETAAWEANYADEDAEPLDWWHFTDNPVTFVNHFEQEQSA